MNNNEIFASLFNFDFFVELVTTMPEELKQIDEEYVAQHHVNKKGEDVWNDELMVKYHFPKRRRLFYLGVFSLVRVCKATWGIRSQFFPRVTLDRYAYLGYLRKAKSLFDPQSVSCLSDNKTVLTKVVENATGVTSLDLGYKYVDPCDEDRFVFDLTTLEKYPNIKSLSLRNAKVIGSTKKDLDLHLTDCSYSNTTLLGKGRLYIDSDSLVSLRPPMRKAREIYIKSRTTSVRPLENFSVTLLSIDSSYVRGLDHATVEKLILSCGPKDIHKRYRRQDIPAKTLVVTNPVLERRLNSPRK
jgi:hypothetical protein